MPGQLIHTNEIMVLLGDNWFAERSATQAVEIAKRRLESKSDLEQSTCP
jgi:unconventional prefoldin RPB5 interactor 1